jgi:hypothetical protein
MHLAFDTLTMSVYEKFNDVLIGSPMLFIHGIVHVKSIKSIEGRRSRATCFLYVALHV